LSSTKCGGIIVCDILESEINAPTKKSVVTVGRKGIGTANTSSPEKKHGPL